MLTKGLLVRFTAKAGKQDAVEAFLRDALPAARAEVGTTAWFGVRFGPREFGIVDVFPDELARDAHLQGQIASALTARAAELFSEPPRIQKLDVLADKRPRGAAGPVTKGVFLHFKPKRQNEQSVEQFLRDSQEIVNDEPGTTAWFAVRIEGGEYGIFDVFPDNRARTTHLIGRVPRELAKHAFELLGGVPKLSLVRVMADKLAM